MKKFHYLLLAAVGLSAGVVTADDWPRYHGVNHDLISGDKGWNPVLPTQGPKVAWKANLGPGAVSVIVRDGKLYSMGNVDDQDIIYCLDAVTGKEIWRHSYPCPLDKRQFEGGPAATPTLDGDHLYSLSHDGQLMCVDITNGKQVWRQDVIKEFGAVRPQWGYAGSPLVEANLVIVDVGGEGVSTLAFNKTDGKLVWKAGSDKAGYASPMPYGPNALLVFKAQALVAMDKTTGKELWRHPWKTSYDVNATAPKVAGKNLLFLSTGYNRGCALLETSPGGVKVLWENKKLSTQMNAALVWEGHAYGIDGNSGKGTLKCVEIKTGEEKWAEGNIGCGALTVADEKLIVMGERGELIIAKAQPTGFEALSRAQVLGGRVWVVPVIANGRIYAKNNQGALVCLDVTAK
jgi:outer membrane protein assembly factor BamB